MFVLFSHVGRLNQGRQLEFSGQVGSVGLGPASIDFIPRGGRGDSSRELAAASPSMIVAHPWELNYFRFHILTLLFPPQQREHKQKCTFDLAWFRSTGGDEGVCRPMLYIKHLLKAAKTRYGLTTHLYAHT